MAFAKKQCSLLRNYDWDLTLTLKHNINEERNSVVECIPFLKQGKTYYPTKFVNYNGVYFLYNYTLILLLNLLISVCGTCGGNFYSPFFCFILAHSFHQGFPGHYFIV